MTITLNPNGDVSTGIVDSPSKDNPSTGTSWGASARVRPRPRIKRAGSDDDDFTVKARKSISIDDLYSEREALSIAFTTALSLLQEGVELAEEAKKHVREDDLFSADDAIVRLHSLLPEMFACRDIGDGYGAIVGALMFSLENKGGDPLDERQVKALLRVMRKIRSFPFMGFDAAVDLIMLLDDAGFVTEPGEFKHYAAWLDEGEKDE